MNDIDKIFKDVFGDEINVKEELANIKEEVEQIDKKPSMIDEIFTRLEYFQMRYGTIEKSTLDRSVELLLDKVNAHMERTEYYCDGCGTRYKISYVVGNDKIDHTSFFPSSTYDISHSYNIYHHAIRCNFCDRIFKISSPYEFIGVFEIMGKRGVSL